MVIIVSSLVEGWIGAEEILGRDILLVTIERAAFRQGAAEGFEQNGTASSAGRTLRRRLPAAASPHLRVTAGDWRVVGCAARRLQ
jgi:hypothetical protein